MSASPEISSSASTTKESIKLALQVEEKYNQRLDTELETIVDSFNDIIKVSKVV